MSELHSIPPQQPDAPQADTPEAKEKRVKLPEEKQFDRRVYGGLGGVITTGLSMVGADWINHGAGKEQCAKAAESFGGKLSKLTGMPRAKGVDVAHSWIVTTGMMMGGLTMLYPIKRAEDGKAAWVRKRHEHNIAKREAAGEVVSDEEKAKGQAALAALDRVPKQTWGSIAIGRTVGTVGVYGVMGAAGKHIKQVAARAGSVSASAVAEAASPTHAAVKRTVDSGILEGACTAICTAILYVYTHAVHPHKKTEPAAAALPEDHHIENDNLSLPSDNHTDTSAPTHARRHAPMQDYRQLASQAASAPSTPAL